MVFLLLVKLVTCRAGCCHPLRCVASSRPSDNWMPLLQQVISSGISPGVDVGRDPSARCSVCIRVHVFGCNNQQILYLESEILGARWLSIKCYAIGSCVQVKVDKIG
jgi:hypothetical protein